MAHQRGREGDEADIPVQQLLGLSFLTLPDLAHDTIASFLPDGAWGTKCSRLRVSEVLHELLKFYGGTLTRVTLCYVKERSAARLAAFLQRQSKLADMWVESAGYNFSSPLPSHRPRLLSRASED